MRRARTARASLLVKTTGSRGPAHALDAGNEGQFALENLPVEKEQGAEGLVLSGGSDVALKGEVAEEGCNLFFAHLLRMALVMEQNKATDPVDVSLFAADAVAFKAKARAEAVILVLFRRREAPGKRRRQADRLPPVVEKRERRRVRARRGWRRW